METKMFVRLTSMLLNKVLQLASAHLVRQVANEDVGVGALLGGGGGVFLGGAHGGWMDGGRKEGELAMSS